MERKVGEICTHNDKTYQIVEVETDEECKGCAFESSSCCSCCISFLGDCSPKYRTDGKSVIFKEINNNMEIKNNQLTIDVPEGMEIDLENSDLAKGIVKFKKKDITYDDILQACPTNFSGLKVHTHCIDKILAISQLMNIAKYYNGDWEPDWNNIKEYKYHIIYNNKTDIYRVDFNNSFALSTIYFKNRENAIAVINNPHFKNILDNIYKN